VKGTPNGSERIFHRVHGGTRFYATLSSRKETEAVLDKLQGFKNEFADFGKFKQEIADLNPLYDQINRARNRVLQLIADSEAQIVFSQECDLLGKPPE